MISSTTTVRVRYAETDKMGIVYHGNYFTWLEIARVHMLDELNYPYSTLEAQGYLLPVLEAHGKFIQPARFDDTVTLNLQIPERPRVKIHIDYRLYRDETLLMTGSTVHTFMSLAGQAIRPPKEWSAMMDKHYA